jgi:hypothetical protein
VKPDTAARPGWRAHVLLALVLAPLLALFFIYGRSIPQDPGYHVFADFRTCLGVRNFGNVASNLLFLAVGAIGMAWCLGNAGMAARRSWSVFFLGVALVFFGSGYYHYSPSDDSLVWDRLPMAIAFMGLFVALLVEQLSGGNEHGNGSARNEIAMLAAALIIGIGSVVLWKYTNDLRVYLWVQVTPLLVIPYLIAAYPARFTHRHYLIYGVGFYALAIIAQYLDYGIYNATGTVISGHSFKHLVAAGAPFSLYLMLRRRKSKDEG